MKLTNQVSLDHSTGAAFFRIVGVWPIGTIVSLTDGSIAVVRDENEEDIFCPYVEIISPAEKKGMVNLQEVKGQIEIKDFLNPFNEGKSYLSMI